MKTEIRSLPLLSLLLACGLSACVRAQEPAQPDGPWPPALAGAVNGTFTVQSADFLTVPESVEQRRALIGVAPFVLAKTAPTVELALHNNLPDRALNGTGWSSWGDIEVARDGRVYAGTGNHGRNSEMPEAGGGRAFLYCWNPATKTLQQVVDVNAVLKPLPGDPTWSKVHAGIHEGADGGIYFSCTLNDGGRSFQTQWTGRVPGGQLFRYDPATGRTEVIGVFPGEVTPTTELDRARNIFYGNMEGKTKPSDIALTAFDLKTRKVIFQSAHNAVTASRNLALARNGAIYFNGAGGLWKYDPDTRKIAATKAQWGKETSMRSSTLESAEGYIYGTTMRPAQLFRYSPAKDSLEMLGPDFLVGDYTTVTVLSPDEKYVYYLPGAHGGAADIGTPVVQYDIARRQRKVLGFLRAPLEKATGYSPAGTYGVDISADGSTLYVGFNGNVTDPAIRPKKHAKGFGLTSFAAIHIPASER